MTLKGTVKSSVNNASVFLPRLGLSCLILCIFSGIILVFYYRPLGDVFQNVEEITTLVPYGKFYRLIHYAAGHSFVILMLLHTLDHLIKHRYRMYGQREWILLVLALCFCFLALFTGFILKGDKEGYFAGRILMCIIEAVPIVGKRMANLFIRPGNDFYFLPYLYHCYFLPVVILFCVKKHIRPWFRDYASLSLATIGVFAYATLFKAGLSAPPGAEMTTIRGPWFFLGIQFLLKTFPPLLAGVLMPSIIVLGLCILPAARNQYGKAVYWILVLSVGLYGFISVWSLLRP